MCDIHLFVRDLVCAVHIITNEALMLVQCAVWCSLPSNLPVFTAVPVNSLQLSYVIVK